MFTNIGPIYSCRIMRDKRTGYSFGYGFVNYVKTQDALKAITVINKLMRCCCCCCRCCYCCRVAVVVAPVVVVVVVAVVVIVVFVAAAAVNDEL